MNQNHTLIVTGQKTEEQTPCSFFSCPLANTEMGEPWPKSSTQLQGSLISLRLDHLLPHVSEGANNRAAALYPKIKTILEG